MVTVTHTDKARELKEADSVNSHHERDFMHLFGPGTFPV